MFLGAGAVATKTYVDDLFSTNVWSGNSTARSINNGIDLSGEGGMLWIKRRNQSEEHIIVDTARGAANYIASSNSDGSNEGSSITSFNSTGFSLGTGNHVNGNTYTYAGWNFRKAPGFFDVVTWTGNGTAGRTISHSLSSVPGMIIVKRTDTTADWAVYHRSNGATKIFYLNSSGGIVTDSDPWNDTEPTSSVFTVGDHAMVNASSATYVAYLFAGGESTAATARSVDFDGSNDYLSIPDSADFNLGTSSFTIECWVYPDAGSMSSGYYGMICGQTSDNWYIAIRGGSGLNSIQYYDGVSAHNSAANSIPEGQWTHVAFVNNSGTGTWYINGVSSTSGDAVSAPNIPNSSGAFEIGRNNSSNYFNGKISNFRIVKGTAVYTSAFRPSTAPLTNITNTKLLCCNDSSQTGSTVTPGTITNNGSTASSDSPFDDPAGFDFGDAGDQNVIKCGSYAGSGSAGLEVNLGWEPQYLMVKRTSGSSSWAVFDSMRGIVTDGNDPYLYPNLSDVETTHVDRIDLTSTGFKITATTNMVNGSGENYVFLALRRPDGYVGKPYGAGEGTSVFNMVMGTSNSDIPAFVSGFVTDFAFNRQPAASENWWTQSRMTGDHYLVANNTDAESTSSPNEWDFMNGWYSSTSDHSNQQSWNWKRHKGFDVVTYGDGTSAARQIPHSLSKVPEMLWVKKRDSVEDWAVYHKGMNGGSSPEDYYMNLNTDGGETDASSRWNDSAPTATHFTVGTSASVNGTNGEYLAMLFASVDGISKVGSYTGDGTNPRTITTGFTPRLVLIKPVASGGNWMLWDSVRGLDASGDEAYLYLNTTGAESGGADYIDTASNGFTLKAANGSGSEYIYYAHA